MRKLDYQNFNLKPAVPALRSRLMRSFLVIIGEEELKNKQLAVKNALTKEQELIPENEDFRVF